MPEYLHRAVLIARASDAALSAAIAQALGPSPRDDLSFTSIQATRDGIAYQVCDTPVTEDTRDAYAAMTTNPVMLHAAVVAGWERKGMEPPPLTLAEVEGWLARTTIHLTDAWAVSGTSVQDVLQQLGFEYVAPSTDDSLGQSA